MRRTISVIVAALALVCAGCSGKSEPTTPSPAQSVIPLNQEERFRLGTEVVTNYQRELAKVEAAGGSRALPDSLREYVADEAAKQTEVVLSAQAERGYKLNDPVVLKGFAEEQAKVGVVVTITACLDASRATGTDREGKPMQLHSVELHRDLAWRDGKLKIVASQDKPVAAC